MPGASLTNTLRWIFFFFFKLYEKKASKDKSSIWDGDYVGLEMGAGGEDDHPGRKSYCLTS